MALRPDFRPSEVTFVKKQVKNGSTVLQGVGVKFSSNGETEVDVCGAGDAAYGVAMETVVGDGTKQVEIAVSCGGIVPVKIVGNVTCGDYLECGASGFVSRTLGGGTTLRHITGKATQTGVNGDLIGCILGQFAGVSA
jgi:hypothetical protein